MARTTIRSEDITGLQVKTGDIAADAVTAAKIASGAVDTTGLEDDIALIGFKVAANGSLAKYNLVDQAIDAFEDASGVDASASTNEIRNSSKYYSGVTTGVVTATGGTITTDGDYTVHYFGSDANFVTDTEQDVEYLVVGGGGSGAEATANMANTNRIPHFIPANRAPIAILKSDRKEFMRVLIMII